jgi:hypothetical protein
MKTGQSIAFWQKFLGDFSPRNTWRLKAALSTATNRLAGHRENDTLTVMG